ncbi:hypothetical protein AOQ84DRAFT_228163 [Glonium stellatum]|uniref:Uncharacterized protein n=1 Tax=Glonium stellatum TaxID=574774 RepID=A0A8E2EQI1_9PEZI|nr:hypothetical protein AOQ84DRAFT_228163 [Glonium stellatum]
MGAITTTQIYPTSTAPIEPKTPATSIGTIASSHPGSASLSTGEIVGIAFGAFVAIAALVAGILLFIYKVRWSPSPQPPQLPSPLLYRQEASMIPQYKPELGGRQVLSHELPTQVGHFYAVCSFVTDTVCNMSRTNFQGKMVQYRG